jgi:hypothetical protein
MVAKSIRRMMAACDPEPPPTVHRSTSESAVPEGTTLGSQRFGEVDMPDLLLDHLIGCGQERFRDGKAERLGGLEVEYKLEFGRRLALEGRPAFRHEKCDR